MNERYVSDYRNNTPKVGDVVVIRDLPYEVTKVTKAQAVAVKLVAEGQKAEVNQYGDQEVRFTLKYGDVITKPGHSKTYARARFLNEDETVQGLLDADAKERAEQQAVREAKEKKQEEHENRQVELAMQQRLVVEAGAHDGVMQVQFSLPYGGWGEGVAIVEDTEEFNWKTGEQYKAKSVRFYGATQRAWRRDGGWVLERAEGGSYSSESGRTVEEALRKLIAGLCGRYC